MLDLREQIAIGEQAAKDKIFQWYINHVSKYWKIQAEKEGENDIKFDDTNDQPITNMLRNIAMKYDIINENDKDKFDFNTWCDMI